MITGVTGSVQFNRENWEFFSHKPFWFVLWSSFFFSLTSVTVWSITHCTWVHLVLVYDCSPACASQSRSKRHGPLPREAHLRPAQPPEGVHGPQLDHGGRQPVTVPSSGPPACAQGANGPQLAPHRHVQEDAGVGRGSHHPGRRPAHHPGGHPANRIRAQLHLLVLEGLLQLKTLSAFPISTGCNGFSTQHDEFFIMPFLQYTPSF